MITKKHGKPFRVKTVLFDFDGTLTKPGGIDFLAIKSAIACPPEIPLLEFIDTLPPEQRANAETVLDRFETEAAAKAEPHDAAEELVAELRASGLRVGVLTRNSLASVLRSLENFPALSKDDFDIIVSRDDPAEPKPSADGVLLAARELNCGPEEILVMGDYVFDIQAGRNAGSVTVFLDNGTVPESQKIDGDFNVTRLEDVKDIIRLGTPLDAGKFPNALLGQALDGLLRDDPSVLVRPGIGEDVAAVRTDGDEIVVLKSDPITFATDAVGHYAVLVNANDIATSGATPRWFLATLMFPLETTPSQVFNVIRELASVCEKWGITLCGGHTEITDAATRPVVSGMLAGTVSTGNLLEKKNMRPGDRIIMTKTAGVEGTSIIAREFEDRLLKLGMAPEEISAGKRFLDKIGVLAEAEIAAQFGATAMHDVTEGGIATALEELGIAGGLGIRVRMDAIQTDPVTEKMCGLLGVDPLGLIGSGSLLIACEKQHADGLVKTIRKAGIHAACIGKALETRDGIEAVKDGQPVSWPRFDRDEIARLFQGQ